MTVAYRVIAPLVLAKDQQGRVHHYYSAESRAGDSIIPWLSDEQAEHFLNEGLVEKITIGGAVESADVSPNRVAECVEALAELNLAPDAGAPVAREALRGGGQRFSNESIAAAIKARKSGQSA
ncbi:hypothetical protein BOH72_23380 [Mycobacterium sp. WY10]|nr:hypothetical protein BOH72_23380 [Mycobacterium sp. WY10]